MKKFNEHFINAASRLKLRHYPSRSNECKTLDDELIKKFKFLSSILKIKENFKSLDKFTFQSVVTN